MHEGPSIDDHIFRVRKHDGSESPPSGILTTVAVANSGVELRSERSEEEHLTVPPSQVPMDHPWLFVATAISNTSTIHCHSRTILRGCQN